MAYSPGLGLFGFDPDGGTFELLAVQGTNLSGWPLSGTFANYKTDFTDGLSATIIKAGQAGQNDIVLISNGTDNVFAMYQDHIMHDLLDTNYSCPKTTALAYYGNRVWALKGNLASFSDAYPVTYYPTGAVITGDCSTFTGTTNDKIKVTIDSVVYDNINIGACTTIDLVVTAINTATGGTQASKVGGFLVITSTSVGTSSNCTIADGTSTAQTVVAKLFNTATRTRSGYAPFDRVTNAFRVPVGSARAIVPTRDQGLIFFGADQIWQLAPSTVPSPVTDFPMKVLDIGCASGNTAVQCADDIIFLAPDGVRGLFRTQLDKLQTGQSFPLSYSLQDQFNNINWGNISGACAVYFENKYIISLPTGTSTHNNECWVFYPALKAWVVYSGWNISRFAKLRVDGKETLFGIDSVTGKTYRLFSGTNDDGATIVYDEISRAEDYQSPLQYKYGGEFKLRVRGGNGTLVVLANADGNGWVQLGTLDLALSGVTFPTTFPVSFSNNAETEGLWHLDNFGIIKFKRCKFEIYCDTPDALITVIESVSTCFAEPYLTDDTN